MGKENCRLSRQFSLGRSEPQPDDMTVVLNADAVEYITGQERFIQ